jgi:hypothetical protein
MARWLKVDLTRQLRGRGMTAICAFLPSRQRTSRGTVAQRRLRFFRLFIEGREPQRGSAHVADLSPGSVSHEPQEPPRVGLAPEVASSALNAPRASSRKLRMRVRAVGLWEIVKRLEAVEDGGVGLRVLNLGGETVDTKSATGNSFSPSSLASRSSNAK